MKPALYGLEDKDLRVYILSNRNGIGWNLLAVKEPCASQNSCIINCKFVRNFKKEKSWIKGSQILLSSSNSLVTMR